MASRAVHWHEGMFLRPHHFQASFRYLVELSNRNHNWDIHYNWGLRSIDIDMTALANHRLVIHSLQGRLRDGTPVVIPGDGALPTVDLRPAFQNKQTRQFMVYLAVPALYMGRLNVSAERHPDYRYFHDSMEFEDENSGGNPQLVPVRSLNFQILVGNQDQTGLEVLPIARLQHGDQANAGPQLDPTYIPPILSCDAWKPFMEDTLRAIQGRVERKIDWLVETINRQGITFDRQAPGDALILKQLQQLNEAVTVFDMFFSAPGLHPLTAFLELSRVMGKLAIFGATRHPPDLPRYNHDDLGTCFMHLRHHMNTQLDIVAEPEYKERPFIGAGWRMQVELEPVWLDPSAQIYIGVQSSLEAIQCVTLLTKAGQLDMKVGSSDRVEELFTKGVAGLRFAAEQLPPTALPKVTGQVYFQVAQEPKNPEWLNLKKTLVLALRLNERMIVGNIQNQRRLTIKAGGRDFWMQFTLYVLPAKKP